MPNKKGNRVKRILVNVFSLLVFSFSIVAIIAISKRMIESYKENEVLKDEIDRIVDEIKVLDDERKNGEYYDIYVKDNYTVYDGEVIIEFIK